MQQNTEKYKNNNTYLSHRHIYTSEKEGGKEEKNNNQL